MTDELSHVYMHFGNGGLQLDIQIVEGVLGIQAEHHQFGLPSVRSFIPLLYDETQYWHHFDRSFTSAAGRVKPPKDPNDNSNNDTLFLWLHAQLNEIKDWMDKNPNKTLMDYQIYKKLSG